MNFYASKGFPKSKLNAVLPFYGQSFKLANSDNNYGAKVVGPGKQKRWSKSSKLCKKINCLEYRCCWIVYSTKWNVGIL